MILKEHEPFINDDINRVSATNYSGLSAAMDDRLMAYSLVNWPVLLENEQEL